MIFRHISIVRPCRYIMLIAYNRRCRCRMRRINNHIPARHIRSINMFKRQLSPPRYKATASESAFQRFEFPFLNMIFSPFP